MIPIQYRDAETEALLECKAEEEVPPIGRKVRVGIEEYRVLYRSRSGPGATEVFVHRVVTGRRARGAENVEVTDFEAAGLEPDLLAHYQEYFDGYFNDEFRFGQGTEHILETLGRFGRGGRWIDLGAGPNTLFWSIPLREVCSITCSDVAVEALKVLNDFVLDGGAPTCYRQVLDMYDKPITHLDEMRRRVDKYRVFNAMEPWPEELAQERYDLITEFGLFGLAPSQERYLECFEHVREHLQHDGRMIGADWIRSPAYVRQEGHDNSYLSRGLIVRGAERAHAELLYCQRFEIEDDPLYDAVMVWAMGSETAS